MPQITMRELTSLPIYQQLEFLRQYNIVPIQVGVSRLIFKKTKKIGIGRNQAN